MNYVIYDSEGNRLDHLTQWDVNRILVISDLEVAAAPAVHFFNVKSAKAIVVPSTKLDDGTYKVIIPNSLLQTPLAVAAAIYISYLDTHECTTKEIIRLPLYPRPMPEDYEMAEDPDYINFALIEEEMLILMEDFQAYADEARSAADYAYQAVQDTSDATERALAAAATADTAAASANAAGAKVTGMTVSATKLDAGANPTATISGDPYHITFGIPKGDKGSKGDTGNGVSSTAVAYAVGTGNTIPTSGWGTDPTITVPSGSWLWVRTTISYTSGNPTVIYSKAFQGINGSGSVVKVDSIDPGTDGNVPLGAVAYSRSQTLTKAQKQQVFDNLLTYWGTV